MMRCLKRMCVGMKNIKIVTDSTCDLSIAEMEKLQIHMIPLSISIDGKTYLDRIEIQPDTFIEKMKKASNLPKSSQPSVGTFLELYDELGKDGSEVLSIHMTEKLSGTYQSAQSAAQMTKTKVTVVDSMFISKALGFQVRKAAQLVNLRYPLDKIIEKLEQIRANTKLYVAMETLENLAKGGRIGKGTALLGSMLNIKPIIKMENGEIEPLGRARGQSAIIKKLLSQFINDIKGKTVESIAVCHADSYELALKIKTQIEETLSHIEVEIDDTTPIISTHTGAGAVGLIYYTA